MHALATPPRIALASVAGAIVVSAALASAASLGGAVSAELTAGSAAVTSCDGDGVGVTYTSSGSAVQSVTVTGVAAACVNGALRVVLADSGGSTIAAGGPETVGGSSVAVPLSPQPSAASVAGVHVSIAGP